jgi:exodeoxyribonuclease X
MFTERALVFDTETTGKHDPHIIEAAWIDVQLDWVERDRYVERFNPLKPIEHGAMAVHHIVDSDLVGHKSHLEFSLPEGVGYLVGHNIDYDWRVAGEPEIKRICTLALSRFLHPEIESHNQSALMYRFFGASARDMVKNAHSALTDVENCLKLLRIFVGELIERGQSVATWEALWVISEQARIPIYMPFGKHKGIPIAELPADYCSWLLRQLDLDPYLVKALRRD